MSDIKNEKEKFALLVGTLVHIHKKFIEKGIDCEPLETAMAAALLIDEGSLPEEIVQEMAAIASVFLSPDAPEQEKKATLTLIRAN